jgi:hypothetical protein
VGIERINRKPMDSGKAKTSRSFIRPMATFAVGPGPLKISYEMTRATVAIKSIKKEIFSGLLYLFIDLFKEY